VSLQEVDSIQTGDAPDDRPDAALKRRIAGEEAVGFA
jgi:hypothetical protein